ncbi:MAG: hypothetical protein H6R26_1342 [Proteobacteria bacterium]|nr:hypothetical protein [Pseudomonadota bacterium]
MPSDKTGLLFMPRTHGKRWLIHLMVAWLLAYGHPAMAVEIVCNRDVPISRLTTRELQAIFTMRLRAWPNGTPVRVFVLNDSAPTHVEFAKKVMDMFPYQLRRYWDKLVFSGTGQAPVELDSPKQVYERLVATPGAIGYLPETLIDARLNVVTVSAP